MTSRYVKSLLVMMAVAVAFPASSSAIENPIIDFGSGYAKENGRIVDEHLSSAGDLLTIVGTVVVFQDPFADLDPSDPLLEYTYVMDGLVSLGTIQTGAIPLAFYDTDYAGGSLRVYCDDTPDADFADMGTFMDGELILEGSFSSFHVATQSFACSGTQNGELVFTGGTLFDRVSDGGVGFTAFDTGLFSVCEGFVPNDLEDLGYFALSDTKIDLELPTALEPSTWGKIKKQY